MALQKQKQNNNKKETHSHNPENHRFRTVTPKREHSNVTKIDYSLPTDSAVEICTTSNCVPHPLPCKDFHLLISTVSDSTWVLRVGTFNNT